MSLERTEHDVSGRSIGVRARVRRCSYRGHRHKSGASACIPAASLRAGPRAATESVPSLMSSVHVHSSACTTAHGEERTDGAWAEV